MTTSELKQYIDKVLGNSIRCLLPSYWWKRLFHQVADRIDEVEQKMDNLPDGVPIVSSESALNRLDVPIGSIASIANKKTMKFSECYVLTDEDGHLTDEELFAKMTPVTGIEMNFPLPDISTADTSIKLIAEGVKGLGFLTISEGFCSAVFALEEETDKYWILSSQASVDGLNEYLSQQRWCFYDDPEKVGAENMALFDQIFTIVDCSSDVYVKSLAWERLAKESDLGGIESGSGDDNVVTFYAPTDISSISDTEKQHNAESYQKIAEGFETDKYYDVKVLMSTSQLVIFDAIQILNPAIDDGKLKLLFRWVSDNREQILTVTSDGSATKETKESHFDSELSDTSENAVQNKVVTAALNNKVDKEELNNAVETITNTIIENEGITAAALNDLNNRLNNIVVTLYLPSGETQTEEEKLKNKSAYDIYLASLDNPPIVRLYNGLQYLNAAMYGYNSELGMLVGIIHKADVIRQSVYTIQSDGTISPLESE